MARFEQLAESLDQLEINKSTSNEYKSCLNTISGFLKQLQNLADEFLELSSHTYDNLHLKNEMLCPN